MSSRWGAKNCFTVRSGRCQIQYYYPACFVCILNPYLAHIVAEKSKDLFDHFLPYLINLNQSQSLSSLDKFLTGIKSLWLCFELSSSRNERRTDKGHVLIDWLSGTWVTNVLKSGRSHAFKRTSSTIHGNTCDTMSIIRNRDKIWENF